MAIRKIEYKEGQDLSKIHGVRDVRNVEPFDDGLGRYWPVGDYDEDVRRIKLRHQLAGTTGSHLEKKALKELQKEHEGAPKK